ncbi:MAG TPA: hypothetical protein VIE89_00810 [Candidatus Binatia bacterium]|jgi:hypothetical protein
MDSFDALQLLLALSHAVGFDKVADLLPDGFEESYNHQSFFKSSGKVRWATR